MEWGETFESAEEVAMSRRQSTALEWRRRQAFGRAPICHHCGYVIDTLLDTRMFIDKDDEVRLYHYTPCFNTAMARREIQSASPRRPNKFEIAALLSSTPETTHITTRELTYP